MGIKVFNIYMDVCVYISTRVVCASEYNAALMLSWTFNLIPLFVCLKLKHRMSQCALLT